MNNAIINTKEITNYTVAINHLAAHMASAIIDEQCDPQECLIELLQDIVTDAQEIIERSFRIKINELQKEEETLADLLENAFSAIVSPD